MRIHLFTQNASHAHGALGIRCLRDTLRQAGYDATISESTRRDHSHTVLARLYGQDATLYGFSCYIWNIEDMLSLAADLKAIRPHCKIVLGGPEVSFDTDRFTALPFVDAILVGEGEGAILKAAELTAKGEALPKLIQGEPHTDLTAEGIHYTVGETAASLLYYESSRGCPFSCSFCLSGASGDKRVRAKRAEVALADLALFEQFPHPLTVKLVDRTFNYDRERAKAIWRGLLSDTYTKCYHFEIAAHLLDEESFALLARFPKGKLRLEIGLQSTNEHTLAAVARHTDAQAVLTAARRLTDTGNVHIHLDLIAGLPNEDMASFARSFDSAYFCCHVLQLGFLKLLHGTPLRQEAEKNGVIAEQNAPYTVLKTDHLSFEDITVLHGVADLCERLRDSGRFLHTLTLLLPRHLAPFEFYSGFFDYLRRAKGCEIQKISQRELFVLLSRYLKETLPPHLHPAISEALRADFAASEVRKPPREL